MLWTLEYLEYPEYLEYLDLKCSSFTLALPNGLIRHTPARPLLAPLSFRHVLML